MPVTINGNGIVTGLDSEGSSDLNTKLEAAGGLVMVTPTTIANSGGTATLTSGAVAFSAVSSVSLNGCFTSAYENYRIIISGVASGGAIDALLRLRSAGTDNSASNYRFGRYYVGVSVSLAGASNNNLSATSYNFGELTGQASIFCDISRPFETSLTTLSALTAGNYLYIVGGQSTVTTSYDGITLLSSSGTLTGTIRVYGYRNGV